MAINFPSNPTKDDEHTSSGVVWVCISSITSGDSYDAWGRKAITQEAGTGDLHYAHSQSVAAATWAIAHNLGKYPSVTVVDSGGTEVEGDIDHLSINSCNIIFSAPFTGKAYLN